MNLENKISRRIGRAILQYEMIKEGDRIIVAVSGGKDSLSLLYFLNQKKKSFPFSFELKPVHVATELADPGNVEKIRDLIGHWGLSMDVININVQERLKEGRKMNCYWCSTQRRTELLAYAEREGCNKIALGHHMDDILETFLMNMMYKKELSTMLPVLKYDNYPITMIRPLALVLEKSIIQFAVQSGISQTACTCGFDDTSKRKEVRTILDTIAAEGDFIKENMYKAMGNPVFRYLPGCEEGGKAAVARPRNVKEIHDDE